MTKINLYGILREEFGDSAFLEIESAKDVIDALDVNKRGFKKRLFDLGFQGFHYTVLVNKKRIDDPIDFLFMKKPKNIDIIPILNGSGVDPISILFVVIAVVATILLAPEPPKPPEVEAQTQGLEKSFAFSSLTNRAAQATPVPVGYGELLIGSEVIQSCIKSYPQNQRSFEAFRRNPFNGSENPTQSSSQLV